MQIHEKIGEGSFAIVYRATERNGSNQKVAIKVIKSEHDILSFNADINYDDVCRTALQEIKAMEVGVSRVCVHVLLVSRKHWNAHSSRRSRIQRNKNLKFFVIFFVLPLRLCCDTGDRTSP